MYERFYNLRERPFSLSPDPDYLYRSRTHHEALACLQYGIGGYAGIVVLTGEARVAWLTRVGDDFELLSPGEDGLHRSQAFPGLWLDEKALLAGDLPKLLAAAAAGSSSTEHRDFVKGLQARRRLRG